MQRFNPYTWSYESIRARPDRTFYTDMIKALEEVKSHLDPQISERNKESGRGVTKLLKRYYFKEKDRSQLLHPVSDVIKKHTNLDISQYVITIDPSLNAESSGVHIFLVFFSEGTKETSILRRDILGNAKSFDETLQKFKEMHHTALSLDRVVGKFKKTHSLTGKISVHSGFFDALYTGTVPIDTLASVIVHEVGHAIDAFDISLRMVCVSDLGEDLLAYKEDQLSPKTCVTMLETLKSGILQARMDSKLRKKYLSSIKSLESDKDHTKEWMSSVSALYTLGVRQIELDLLSKSETYPTLKDSVISNDSFKGAERRADRYAGLYGLSGVIDFCDVFTNAQRISETFGHTERDITKFQELLWHTQRDNEYGYDTFYRRAHEMLKTKYLALKQMQEDGASKKDLADYAKGIAMAEQVVGGMKSAEQRLRERSRTLDKIHDSIVRALTIFSSRDRVSQNSILSDAIRDVARSPLHYDAYRVSQTE